MTKSWEGVDDHLGQGISLGLAVHNGREGAPGLQEVNARDIILHHLHEPTQRIQLSCVRQRLPRRLVDSHMVGRQGTLPSADDKPCDT